MSHVLLSDTLVTIPQCTDGRKRKTQKRIHQSYRMTVKISKLYKAFTVLRENPSRTEITLLSLQSYFKTTSIKISKPQETTMTDSGGDLKIPRDVDLDMMKGAVESTEKKRARLKKEREMRELAEKAGKDSQNRRGGGQGDGSSQGGASTQATSSS